MKYTYTRPVINDRGEVTTHITLRDESNNYVAEGLANLGTDPVQFESRILAAARVVKAVATYPDPTEKYWDLDTGTLLNQ